MTSEANMAAPAEPTAQFVVQEDSPSYWKVTFENGPVNLIDADSIGQLARLVTRIEESPTVTVVVFDSANPDYFMAHGDLKADRARVAAMAPGPTGLHPVSGQPGQAEQGARGHDLFEYQSRSQGGWMRLGEAVRAV